MASRLAGHHGRNEAGRPTEVCPDCGSPTTSYGAARHAHSIIDLHWMLYRHAPLDPGPCPVCAAPRELFACGHPETTRRILTWHCTGHESNLLHQPPLLPSEDDPWTAHHAAASAPVQWRHPADADAYWLARDLLRMVVEGGEVTELPESAIHQSLDGTDERWIYRGSEVGRQRLSPATMRPGRDLRLVRLWHARDMDPGELRAGDADRERVAERLRTALDEGRLNIYEYDERLRDAYAAKTYADLDKLLADLPGVAPASRSQLVPADQGALVPARWRQGPDGRYLDATRRWLADMWDEWAGTVAVCLGIWGIPSLFEGDLSFFWPGWVAGPWGVVLLVETVRGLLRDEPQRWAAKQARKEAEREVRRRARQRDR